MKQFLLVALAALALTGALARPAAAETWLCPECGLSVERGATDPTLECLQCGSFPADDLSWVIGYLNYKTRPSETSFVVLPEQCPQFRQEGLQAFTEKRETVWVPWSFVEWYIPRQRILRLVDGREFTTDYAKSRGEPCPLPPKFLFEIADTLRIEGEADRVEVQSIEDDIATLFVLARSESALAKGVARFIQEVEAGNHPRLPRTDNSVTNARVPQIPAAWQGKTLKHKATVKVRTDASRRVLALDLVKSTGDAALDQAALVAARTSTFSTAGEMGVGVPSSVLLHYAFAGSGCTVTAEIPKNSIWEN